jgi:tRNA dimethylallyltransferase
MELSETPQNAAQAATTFPPLDGDAVVLTGPTASGKSAVAIPLAERIGAEIISVDSIAVYRGMDIGTAKPSDEDRRRVPHHLIDVACPSESYSVANFLADAWRAIAKIRAAGRIPLFVGGTPMYLKGLLYGFDPGPPADWDFRQAIEADLQTHGPESLHRRLWQVDPLSAHRLAPSDTRRITRALEVAYLTGIPLSHRQTQFEQTPESLTGRLFVLQWPRATLHDRIAARVHAMFDQGLVDEVRGLREKHPALSRTASIAVGYREVFDLIDGKIAHKTAIQTVIEHTRQLARRQETWLRSLPTLEAIAVADQSQLAGITESLIDRLGHGPTKTQS